MWPFSKKKEESKSKFDFPELSGSEMEVPPKSPEAEEELALEKPPEPGVAALGAEPKAELADIPEPPSPEELKAEGGMPTFPDIPPEPDVHEEAKSLVAEELKPEFPSFEHEEMPESAFVAEEGYHKPLVVKHKMPGSPIFVDIDVFKNVLKEINMSRAGLRKSSDVIARLEDINKVEESEFIKWRNLMNDIHRKMLVVDRTIFE